MEPSDLVIIGNGWVSQNCYQPAAKKAGLSPVHIIDADNVTEIGQRLAALPDVSLGKRQLFVIAVPNQSHFEVLKRVNGPSAIICEKPVVRPWEVRHDPFKTIDLSKIFVSSPNRFRADVKKLQEIVRAGRIGAVKKVKAVWRRCRGIPRPGSWYTSRELAGGGVLVDLGPHILDMGLMLLNFPEMQVRTVELDYLSLAKAADFASPWMALHSGDHMAIDGEMGARFVLYSAGGQIFEGQVEWAGGLHRMKPSFK